MDGLHGKIRSLGHFASSRKAPSRCQISVVSRILNLREGHPSFWPISFRNGCTSVANTRPDEGTSHLYDLAPTMELILHPQVQCRIFNSTFNPQGLRLGNKVLRQRLRGPSVAAYYPRRIGTIKQFRQKYPDYEIEDEHEEERVDKIRQLKLRGKGAPKKKRSKAGEYPWTYYFHVVKEDRD